jgi:hypothetical protein
MRDRDKGALEAEEVIHTEEAKEAMVETKEAMAGAMVALRGHPMGVPGTPAMEIEELIEVGETEETREETMELDQLLEAEEMSLCSSEVSLTMLRNRTLWTSAKTMI